MLTEREALVEGFRSWRDERVAAGARQQPIYLRPGRTIERGVLVADPAEALGLVGEAALAPGGAVDLRFPLRIAGRHGGGVGQQRRCVDPAHFFEQRTQGRRQLGGVVPVRVRGLEAAQVLEAVAEVATMGTVMNIFMVLMAVLVLSS